MDEGLEESPVMVLQETTSVLVCAETNELKRIGSRSPEEKGHQLLAVRPYQPLIRY